jgi:magnesium and cobalt transporter
MDELAQNKPARTWLKRLSHVLSGEPQNREELIEWLRDAANRNLLDLNALGMIEGVLQVSVMQVRDIMIPCTQMIVIQEDATLESILPLVIESHHSRFPVVRNNSEEEVVGVLLAKDLLVYPSSGEKSFNMKDIMRSVAFVPESKRLDALLQDFRRNKQHIAIVIDEYGAVAGLVTIEDVLEQIVGDIDDEYDDSQEEDSFIQKIADSHYAVKALTPIASFNTYFNEQIDEEDFDTLAGLVTNTLGHIPRCGETVVIGQYEFTVTEADNRRIHLMEVRPFSL